MRKIVFILSLWLVCSQSLLADTSVSHCKSPENTLFTCNLSNNKVMSLCSTKNSPSETGYVQFRYGAPGRIEAQIPRIKAGVPSLELVHKKDKYLEYNKVAVINDPLTFKIESFRQFKKTNSDGYPNTKSSDSLNVEDAGKTVWEGNIVLSAGCTQPLGAAANARAIGKITGVKVEEVM
jgi:hypothetical protein